MVCKITIFVRRFFIFLFINSLKIKKIFIRIYLNLKKKKIKTYQKNKKQIDIITKILVDHADIPEEIINKLISCVEENTILANKLSNIN